MTGDSELHALYRGLLAGWNNRDADAMAALFDEAGEVVGFDGTEVAGRAEIGSHLGHVFADHATARFVGKIRGVRLLRPGVAVVRAVAGMVRPGETDLEPSLYAVQTVVAARSDEGWRIALFQNTPAQLHGRPELVERLTDELRAVMRSGSQVESPVSPGPAANTA